MIECDCFDADLHLARAGRRRSWHIGKFQLAIGDQSQRAHVNWLARQAGSSPITNETFWPPKPNEFEIAWRKRASRASLGTTSSGIAGSGIAELMVGGMR